MTWNLLWWNGLRLFRSLNGAGQSKLFDAGTWTPNESKDQTNPNTIDFKKSHKIITQSSRNDCINGVDPLSSDCILHKLKGAAAQKISLPPPYLQCCKLQSSQPSQPVYRLLWFSSQFSQGFFQQSTHQAPLFFLAIRSRLKKSKDCSKSCVF